MPKDLFYQSRAAMRILLQYSAELIDEQFGMDYAKKNPALVGALASIGSDLFVLSQKTETSQCSDHRWKFNPTPGPDGRFYSQCAVCGERDFKS